MLCLPTGEPLTMSSARDEKSKVHQPELKDIFLEVANSEMFQRAPVMRTLLIYLWEQRGTTLSEYAIAVDGLRRSSDFDPRTDSTARVQVARLRAKLKTFYESAGRECPLHITIPHGKHELEWTYASPPAVPVSRPGKSALTYLSALAAALAVVCLVLAGALIVETRQTKAPVNPPGGFWQAFLANGKPVEIVIPSPLFFYFDHPNVSVRDFSITDFPKWQDSPVLRDFGAKWGAPTVYPMYVGAPEMSVGVKILQYLEKRGREVNLVESRKLPADAAGSLNMVFLGMPRTANYLDPMVAKANFYIAGVLPDVIGNRHPLANEPSDFREVVYSSDREVVPAIVTLLPKRPEGTRSLLLMARRLNGLGSILLSPSGLRQIDEELARNGSPDSWEMVIDAEIQDDTVLRVWPVAIHPIPLSFWK
jgi:hypothetical protein